ncbi:uncharacterized protein LOC141649628 [Silene latifolia]|uniref:uncharacterized protein LOC141649628 n=1 Tax=Silene latifolia TaxID=37657 RepID=UPI003D784781
MAPPRPHQQASQLAITSSPSAATATATATGEGDVTPLQRMPTAIKGQAIADFFAHHPVPGEWELTDDLPGEEIFYVDILPPWQMYFDGASRQDGAGVVFITPQNHLMPYAFTLNQLCTNNMAEYQALILGLQIAIEIGVRDMDIYGDLKLVINQVLDEYEVKKEDLIPYHQRAL